MNQLQTKDLSGTADFESKGFMHLWHANSDGIFDDDCMYTSDYCSVVYNQLGGTNSCH
jgi:hypothetical protein